MNINMQESHTFPPEYRTWKIESMWDYVAKFNKCISCAIIVEPASYIDWFNTLIDSVWKEWGK